MLNARVIFDGARTARENMARDTVLFNTAASAPFAATLRLYQWSPHALSLGRRQKVTAADLAGCRERGIDVAQRPGGGSAVYHGEDFSYCFVCRLDLLPPPSAAAWREIFVALAASLHIATDEWKGRSGGSPRNNACFACPAEDEPTIGGKKFVGSARRKSKTVFLQHGSILLHRQPDFIRQLVMGAERDESVGLVDLVPSFTAERGMKTLVAIIEKRLGLVFEPEGLSERESATDEAARVAKVIAPVRP